jgi:hypothetical protein
MLHWVNRPINTMGTIDKFWTIDTVLAPPTAHSETNEADQSHESDAYNDPGNNASNDST